MTIKATNNQGGAGMTKSTRVKIIDLRTRQQVGKDYAYEHRNRARNRAEKLNLEYGAHRYTAKTIFEAVT